MVHDTRRKVVDDLVADVLDLPAAERSAFLSSACHGDDALRAEVESLVAEAESKGILDTTIPFTGLQEGEIVGGRFKILGFLASGGMGSVYEAEDLVLHVHRALKIIKPDIAQSPAMIERFKREINIGQEITSEHVCRVYDLQYHQPSNLDGAKPFLFMTMRLLAPGQTLAKYLSEHGPIPARQALPLLKQMAEGLRAIHAKGYIHRDFKSSNVMLVGSAEEGWRAVITDLGLARNCTQTNVALPVPRSGRSGTPAYQAPEQLSGGELSPATDVYSFGVVMYEMLAGKLPFEGETQAAAEKRADRTLPNLGELPSGLDPRFRQVILRCLDPDPQKRFASARELLEALNGVPETKRPLYKRKAVLIEALVLLLVLLVAGALWRIRSPSLPTEKRVAVLKFENIGGDPANQAFCDGLQESLSSNLTQLEQFKGALSVIPASDLRREQVTSARAAHREFGANIVITGGVQRSSNGVRLTINIVDADHLRQIRSRQIFVSQSDPLEMQEGVVRQVAGLLSIDLHPEAKKVLAQRSTPVPGAYDFYLQGQGYLFSGTNAADQAITEFKHALDLDPNYALAYAGLGQAYWGKYLDTKDRSWVNEAWDACKRAITLNPNLAEAHITLAILDSGTGKYDDAIAESQKAIQLSPDNFQAYSELARALERKGELAEAENTLKKAIDLKPSYWNNYVRLGSFYFRHSRYKDAEQQFQRVIELVPDSPVGYTNLGIMYHLEGREKEAEGMLKKSLGLRRTPEAESNLATTYFFEGRFQEAVPLMEQAVTAKPQDYMLWGNLGDDYRWTGQSEKARHAYEKAAGLASVAITVNPSDAVALSSEALYDAKLGDTEAALTGLSKALSVAADNKNVQFNAAIIYEITGNRERALSYIEDLIQSGYSIAEIEAEPELAGLRRDLRYPLNKPSQGRQ